MDFSIAAILAQDGITNGAVYALLAMALVLLFSVTRVIFVAQGELVAFGALTLAALQAGQVPATIWLLVGLGACAFTLEVVLALWRARKGRSTSVHLMAFSLAVNVVLPLVLLGLLKLFRFNEAGLFLQLLMTLALVVPMGTMIYRLVFQPVMHASVLVLLIISVGVHFVLMGLGLLAFGPEGARTDTLTSASWNAGPVLLSGQSLLVVGVSAALIGALYLFFTHTVTGKALRATAVNRAGARLVGIAPESAGKLAFTLASLLAVLAGVLMGPLTTVQYDTGFLICLKGFVAAIVGALASYPLAAAGAVLVGLIESYGSFWASAYKEVIVFTLIIPVLFWRSLTTRHVEEE